MWSRDGSEIFYRHLDRGELFVTPLDTSAGFRAGTPRRLFEWDAWGFGYSTAYDVSADGTRFLASLPALAEEGGPTYRVVVFENWFEELKRLVPTD